MKLLSYLVFVTIFTFNSIYAVAWIDPMIKQKIINKSDDKLSVIILLKDLPSAYYKFD